MSWLSVIFSYFIIAFFMIHYALPNEGKYTHICNIYNALVVIGLNEFVEILCTYFIGIYILMNLFYGII